MILVDCLRFDIVDRSSPCYRIDGGDAQGVWAARYSQGCRDYLSAWRPARGLGFSLSLPVVPRFFRGERNRSNSTKYWEAVVSVYIVVFPKARSSLAALSTKSGLGASKTYKGKL